MLSMIQLNFFSSMISWLLCACLFFLSRYPVYPLNFLKIIFLSSFNYCEELRVLDFPYQQNTSYSAMASLTLTEDAKRLLKCERKHCYSSLRAQFAFFTEWSWMPKCTPAVPVSLLHGTWEVSQESP